MVALTDFLPSVPTTPPARARQADTPPAARRRRTKPNASATPTAAVTATVTPVRRRRVTSPPVQPSQPAQPEESKRDKFLRIGGHRMVNVLRSIRLLGNLANTGIYEWSEEDVKRMRSVINDQLDLSFAKFSKGSVVRLENVFKLEG